jgi:hypothetical protein
MNFPSTENTLIGTPFKLLVVKKDRPIAFWDAIDL